MNTVFILDSYNEFAPDSVQKLVRYKFKINDYWYAIYEVPLEWGEVMMERPIDEEVKPEFFYFNTYEQAFDFVQELKKINT